MRLGQMIKQARKKAHLTQGQVGEQIGVVQSVVCDYEKGKSSPTVETFIRFGEVVGVPAWLLLARAMDAEFIDLIQKLDPVKKNNVKNTGATKSGGTL